MNSSLAPVIACAKLLVHNYSQTKSNFSAQIPPRGAAKI